MKLTTEIQRYEGNGGLNMAFVSVGFKIHKWWSVGAMLHMVLETSPIEVPN